MSGWFWWLLSFLEPRARFDPRCDDYVGHSMARFCHRAKCICPPDKDEVGSDIMCPFHGR